MARQGTIDFRGRNPDEEVIFLVRAHPFYFLKAGLIIVALAILLLITFAGFGASSVSSFTTFIIVPIVLLVGFRTWFTWVNSTSILTNERLIAVHQRGLFVRDLSEVAVNNILTTNHTIKGPFQTLFNFGDVKIRVSGAAEDEIVLKGVTDPYNLQQRILKAAGKTK